MSWPEFTTPEVGLVLAAGAASRFGAPKQLANFNGAPLITWSIGALRAGGVGRVVVVLGGQHERIAAHLDGADPVLAPDWEEGLSASLRAGVRAAGALGAERAVVVLADQPLLSGAAVARVLQASRDGAPIARATYGATRSHPTVLAAETFAAVAQLRGDAGARNLTGFAILDVVCDGLGAPDDVDTPADLERLSAQHRDAQQRAAERRDAQPSTDQTSG